MKNFEAVLFDFDGVLADTMDDNFKAWKKAFQQKGIEIKREDYFSLEGMKLREIAQTIAGKYQINVEPEEIAALKNKYYLESYCFSLYPGVNELIDGLKVKRKKLAVVSASPKERLDKKVREFLKKFDVVILGEDTKKGKPKPEPYLKAMEKLNVEVKKCIVIENAPLGIKAAKAAGVYCIAITTTLNKSYLQEADEIVESHEELRNLLS